MIVKYKVGRQDHNGREIEKKIQCILEKGSGHRRIEFKKDTVVHVKEQWMDSARTLRRVLYVVLTVMELAEE